MITEQQIRDMEPGRELDALVEQHIFGKTVEWLQDEITDPYPIVPAEYSYIVDHYSTDISAAWEVLERMKEKGAEINVGFYREWDCTLDYPIGCNWREVGNTAPEAICKAALVALIPDIAHMRGGSGE